MYGMEELEEILQLKAAIREPAVTAGLRQFLNGAIPKRPDWIGDAKLIADNQWEGFMCLRTAMTEDPDPGEQNRFVYTVAHVFVVRRVSHRCR